MRLLVLAVAMATSSITYASETLSEVISEVYQAEGMTKDQINNKALQCIKSSAGNAAGAVEPAIDGDSAYAIVRTGYTKAMVSFTVRSRITVLAKDGRFKITHTDIDQFSDLANSYVPVYKSWGTGWQKAEESLKGWFPTISACLLKKPEPKENDNW